MAKTLQRRQHATLLSLPCPVLDQLTGTDATAKLTLFQSCRDLRDAVLANSNEVQLTLDALHGTLGAAAAHQSLQLMAKAKPEASFRLVLKASVKDANVCEPFGEEAAANTAWLTYVCEQMHRAGGQLRQRVRYLELQGAFMCELVPACIINTFPNLQHLVRSGLFIVQPCVQFTPTPCPQLHSLTINTAQLPVTNITEQQMRAQLLAPPNLQQLSMYIDGPPLPYTAEAILQCRVKQRPLIPYEDQQNSSCDEHESDGEDDAGGPNNLSAEPASVAAPHGTTDPDKQQCAAGGFGRNIGAVWIRHLAADRQRLAIGCGHTIHSAGYTAGTGLACSMSALQSSHSNRDWDSIIADGDGNDSDYSPSTDTDSIGSRDDRDYSDNCIDSDEESALFDDTMEGTPYEEAIWFWSKSVKGLQQLSNLHLGESSLFYLVCHKPRWPCLTSLDLSWACQLSDVHVRLLLENTPALAQLQVSAFEICRDFSSSQCSWQHLTVRRHLTIKDLAWLPLSGLQTLQAGPLLVLYAYDQWDPFYAENLWVGPLRDSTGFELVPDAVSNLASCSSVQSHPCPTIAWPNETYAVVDNKRNPRLMPALLPLLQKFNHQHIRVSAEVLLAAEKTAWFEELPHLCTLSIAPVTTADLGTDADAALQLLAQLSALCAQATRPVTVQLHERLCDQLGTGWHATLVAAMQQAGHQHVIIKAV